MIEKYADLEKYPDVLSVKMAAQYIGVSKDTVRKLCLNGEMEHVRVGRLYRITKQHIINFLETTNK